MKKLIKNLIAIGIGTILGLVSISVVSAVTCTNLFPTSLNNYVSGNCIPSSWGNSLEAKIGVDNSAVVTSLDYLVRHNATPSSTITVGAISTSTWVINASGTNIFANNWGGSSTIWIYGGFSDAATNTSPGTFTVATTTSKITITFPPKNDAYFAPSSTIVVGAITTSTWVVNASGGIMFANNWGGSSTIWANVSTTIATKVSQLTNDSAFAIQGVTTSSNMTPGQWVIASGAGTVYSTSSQPAITATSPLVISATGTISTGFSSTTFNNVTSSQIRDSQGNLYSTSTPTLSFDWTIGNETSSTVDCSIHDFTATSTIKTVAAHVSTAGDSMVFNMGWTLDATSASSTWHKLFTSDQTIKSTTSTQITINASTTPNNFAELCYYTGVASSSEFHISGTFTIP